ncbi:uncharacterized protein AtWU_09285 [Aspergillus tubingensis]|uniref:Uncharacterized protein n=1 Tax=Aspergillus niger TaxID=5061 RepID=A0A117E3D2_ASPNG|nr:uncharacterized protein AtWU_09285 [Aspergillus tubingensis]GAQ46927.1 hypothetical protein AKAW_07868 [Aspergillus niger]GFN19481.1 hypothetical protein AtWU_09285 [Aspergillus tubingensis]GLA92157.1 hypothetical protein AtubIFM57143_006820 [Aspergillus tubingensis]
MGYTHYYGVRDTHSTEWVTAWPQLVQDAKRVVDATDVPLSGPTDDPRDDHVTPPLVDEIEGIDINGVAKMSHEPLIIHPKTIRSFEFVKTEGKPYDAAVGCILLRARVLAPKQFRLRSDGSWDEMEWKLARNLYESLWPDQPPDAAVLG